MNLELSTIIKHYPNHWDKNINYTVPYHRINLTRNSDEFDIITSCLRKAQKLQQQPLKMLYRVQNVFAFGQTLIREQYLLKSNKVYTVRRYFVLKECYLDDCIKYNLDPRRCNQPTLTFTSSIGYVNDDEVVLILKVVTTDPNASYFKPEQSSDYWIEYVAYLE